MDQYCRESDVEQNNDKNNQDYNFLVYKTKNQISHV